MAAADLTAARLRELFHYAPETGMFTRRADMYRFRAGSVFGTTRDRDGYLTGKIDGKSYRIHRLAWLYVTVDWPAEEIDHINCVKDDNRFVNLRDVQRSVNSQNKRAAHKSNRSGLLGVRREGNRWGARIGVEKGQIRLGSFETAELAHQAYLRAKTELHSQASL